jgi:large subunit ribosomal protein L13
VRTFQLKPKDVQRKWYIIDASNIVLGTLATKAAVLLRGKHKADYTPNVDSGDHVIIVNAGKIALTGNKQEDKVLYHHSGWLGGMKEQTYKDLIQTNPQKIVEHAIKGMLQQNKIAADQFNRLKVYADEAHEHTAQKPEEYKLSQVEQSNK